MVPTKATGLTVPPSVAMTSAAGCRFNAIGPGTITIRYRNTSTFKLVRRNAGAPGRNRTARLGKRIEMGNGLAFLTKTVAP
jgi:hypothetical protein